jgi:outer membrane phospholipase A
VLLVLFPFGLRGGLEYRLMTGDPSARATGELTVLVVATNSDSDSSASELPDRVEARVGPFVVPLLRDGPDAEVEIGPGTTLLRRYRGALPDDLEGMMAIELVGLNAGRCFVEVVPVASNHVIDVAEQAEPADPENDVPIAPRFADNLSFYEPMYFVVGPRVSLNAKFQLGFKYRLLSAESRLAEVRPFWENLFLGYTQTSIWDLGADSAPFLDTSYKPGLFYFDRYRGVRFLGLELDSFEGGYQHESNGQDGANSRSLNTIYIRPTLRWGSAGGWHLTIAPKIWAYVGGLGDNPDLPDYRGYFDLNLRFGQRDGLELATTFRKGTESGYGSIQLDLTYPLDRILFRNAASYIQLQYFNGWGETLLHYDERFPTQYRIGISLFR